MKIFSSIFKALATPFTAKRKREESAEADQGLPASKKRSAAPNSTQKALRFGQDVGMRNRGGQAGGAERRQQQQGHLTTQEEALLALPLPPPQRGVPQPPVSAPQSAAKPWRLGEATVRQEVAQSRNAYNSPAPAQRQTFSYVRQHGHAPWAAPHGHAPAGGCFLGAGLQHLRERVQRPHVLHSTRSPLTTGLGRDVLLQDYQGNPSLPAAARPLPSASKRFPAPRTAVNTVHPLEQRHPELAGIGYDHKARDKLRKGVQLYQQVEEVHQQHASHKPPEVVDLTTLEEKQEQQQRLGQAQTQQRQREQGEQQVLPGWGGLLPALGAMAPTFAPTPGGRPPFTPSLLALEQQQRYESLYLPGGAAAAGVGEEPAIPAALSSKAPDGGDEDYQKKTVEAAEAKQKAQAITKAALDAARRPHTTLDRSNTLMARLKQIEEELLYQTQRRVAAQIPAAKSPLASKPTAKPVVEAEEEEGDVIELLSDEDEEQHHEVLEESSIAASESEGEFSQQLAELSVSEVLQLTEEQYDTYEDAIRQNGAPQERLVMHERSSIEIRRKDMACMAPLQWLNDEVINLYMSLLQERDGRRRGMPGALRCHFFSTFFANKLYKDTGYCYKDVQRWTLPRRLKAVGQASESILDCDRIILPVHQGVHWVCAVIDMANKQFIYYDSLKGEDHKCLDSLARYVEDEYQAKRNQTVDTSGWDRVFPKNIPQQHNGCDCGVFTLLFADYAGRAAAMGFSQKDINGFRVKIVNDILRLRID